MDSEEEAPDHFAPRPHSPEKITRLWRSRGADKVSKPAEGIWGTNVDRSIERRNSRRFQIALPLLLRWTDSGSHYDSGHCVNIGQGGIFVLCAKVPPMDTAVEVEFVLPAFGSVPRPTRLHCVGRVSRVEVCYRLTGFAIAGQFVNELEGKPSRDESVGKSLDVGF